MTKVPHSAVRVVRRRCVRDDASPPRMSRAGLEAAASRCPHRGASLSRPRLLPVTVGAFLNPRHVLRAGGRLRRASCLTVKAGRVARARAREGTGSSILKSSLSSGDGNEVSFVGKGHQRPPRAVEARTPAEALPSALSSGAAPRGRCGRRAPRCPGPPPPPPVVWPQLRPAPCRERGRARLASSPRLCPGSGADGPGGGQGAGVVRPSCPSRATPSAGEPEPTADPPESSPEATGLSLCTCCGHGRLPIHSGVRGRKMRRRETVASTPLLWLRSGPGTPSPLSPAPGLSFVPLGGLACDLLGFCEPPSIRIPFLPAVLCTGFLSHVPPNCITRVLGFQLGESPTGAQRCPMQYNRGYDSLICLPASSFLDLRRQGSSTAFYL